VMLSYDDEVRAAALQVGRQHLEVAATLGARTVGFSPGMNGRVTREGRIRLAIPTVRQLGELARDLGLRLCQEDYDYFTSDDLLRITEGTGLDNVGIQSDTGNWLILGEDPVFATKKCLPYTFHAHVRDYVLENGVYNGVAWAGRLPDAAADPGAGRRPRAADPLGGGRHRQPRRGRGSPRKLPLPEAMAGRAATALAQLAEAAAARGEGRGTTSPP
jgi:sugar phosphate isomerase/epimerase